MCNGESNSSTREASANEIDSVRNYQAGALYDMNKALRNDEKLSKDDEKEKDNLDRAMQPTDEDMTLWRGYGMGSTDILVNAKVGDVIQDKSFVSTAMSKDGAGKFAFSSDKVNDVKPWVAKIEVPKGTPAINITNMAKAGGGNSIFNKEGEMLLGRGLKMEVTGISNRGSYHTVSMRVVK